MKIAHVIGSLGRGGAEIMLYRLLHASTSDRFQHVVISLSDSGSLREQIEALDVPIFTLGIQRSKIRPTHITHLVKILSEVNADVVHTWMYHSNLLGGLVSKLGSSAPIVWSIHHTELNPVVDSRSTILIARVSAYLSAWVPRHIVCCSKSSLQVHEDLGYRRDRMLVIPNGYDLDELRFEPSAKNSLKEKLALSDKSFLVGMAARFDPQKDHHTLIEAAARLILMKPEVHFILCGDGVDSKNQQLRSWIERTGSAENFHLLGEIESMTEFYSALDIATLSSSHGEAFPNVIAEAMSCEVPCVATDVGDVSEIIADTGIVVTPEDPGALQNAWLSMIERGPAARSALGERARQRIGNHYEIGKITSEYEKLYSALMRATS